MCDIVPGQLIVCFPKADPAGAALMARIREGQIEHVSYIESLDARLTRMNLHPDPSFEFSLHLLAVPRGNEMWKITYLQFFYKHDVLALIASGKLTHEFMEIQGRSDFQFTIVPNSVLSVANSPPSPVIKATQFTFTPLHQAYKALLNLPPVPPPGAAQVKIAILDTGWLPTPGCRPVSAGTSSTGSTQDRPPTIMAMAPLWP